MSYKEKGVLACGDFNGKTLFSDTVTMDSAYLNITGKTKSEFDKWEKEYINKIKKEKQEHKENITNLSKMWSAKEREILTEDKWELWDKIVPIRLNDLYRGIELGNCLEVVEVLNNNGTFEDAKKLLEEQSHSGMSFSLVCSMIKNFCSKGDDFVDYVN